MLKMLEARSLLNFHTEPCGDPNNYLQGVQFKDRTSCKVFQIYAVLFKNCQHSSLNLVNIKKCTFQNQKTFEQPKSLFW